MKESSTFNNTDDSKKWTGETALTTTSGARLELARPTSEVLAHATEVAHALMAVIKSKPEKVMMGGKQYIEFDDWQLVANFYGCTPKVTDHHMVTFQRNGKQVSGFEATAQLVHVQTGRVISEARSMCLDDEDKWCSRNKYKWLYVCVDGTLSEEDPGRERITWIPNPNSTKPGGGSMPKKERSLIGTEDVPLFQLLSMAQTRAQAKVCRNVFSHIVVMAGYSPTPAEELDADRVPQHETTEEPQTPVAPQQQTPRQAPPPQATEPVRQPAAAPRAPAAPPPPARPAAGKSKVSPGMVKRFFAIAIEKGWNRDGAKLMCQNEFNSVPDDLTQGAGNSYEEAIRILNGGPTAYEETLDNR